MTIQTKTEGPLRTDEGARTAGDAVRFLKYLTQRLAAILTTVVIGVFVTIVIANHGGLIDSITEARVRRALSTECLSRSCSGAEMEQLQAQLTDAAGLNLSFLPRHLLWTAKALTLDWGEVAPRSGFRTLYGDYSRRLDSRLIILQYFPNTLLLIGGSYLLLFLLGIPLALYLSRGKNRTLDRLVAALTPVSSIPSWVLGVLLVLVFAVVIRIFPAGGMHNAVISSNWLLRWADLAWHMVLPVLAILLSMLFQLVYNWRTYFMIYADDDYVELARAKGLPERLLERNYILRPGLPYVATSFSLTLVAFWQSITALEYSFGWRGIGNLYVRALPNYNGEAFFRGEMGIVVGIVVIFAYFLGLTVLLLDIFYVLVDPRLRLGGHQATVRLVVHRDRRLRSVRGARPKHGRDRPDWQSVPAAAVSRDRIATKRTSTAKARSRLLSDGFLRGLRQLSRSPAALAGLLMITAMLGGSFYAVVALPYAKVGRSWYLSDLGKNPTVPALAQPIWVNWFRSADLPATILVDNRNGGGEKVIHASADGMTQIDISFQFDYPYTGFPPEAAVYFYPRYQVKRPFVGMTWITPDGRSYDLKATTAIFGSSYRLDENVPYQSMVSQNTHWQEWFVFGGNYPTSPLKLLFADPGADRAIALPGTYTLQIKAFTFEPDSDVDAQLVVFGQVYGLAGTDFMRRDLLVPLLWGLPVALTVGVLGAFTTTLISLLTAGASVWLGGWVDVLIERINEATIIIPILAIAVLFYAFYGFSIWVVLILVILLSAFGSPTKALRAAFLQIKEAPYLEAARAYGASDWRIIWRYLVPRILPVIVPQVISLIPSFVFLEATLAILGVSDPRYPSWGKVLYSALRYGASYGSRFWVLEPIALLLLTGFAFASVGYALNRILNPRLDVGKD